MDLKNPFDAQLMTVSEIAEALRVPESWVYERTRRRGSERMPHIKLGKYLRFELTDVRSVARNDAGELDCKLPAPINTLASSAEPPKRVNRGDTE